MPKEHRGKAKGSKQLEESKEEAVTVMVDDFEGTVMEKGTVDFFYRPKVMLDEAETIQDVNRFYMLLQPSMKHGQAAPFGESYESRLMLMGAKSMPVAKASTLASLHWTFVYKTGTLEEIMGHLEAKEYTTKTRGARRLGGAVPAGRGLYEFVHLHKEGRPKKRGPGNISDTDECIFAYVLEVPKKPGPIQHQLHIAKEASFYCKVKNPMTAAGFSRSGLRVGLRPTRAHPEQLKYPKDLQARFGGVRVGQLKFTSLVPAPEFLDIERTELLMLASSKGIKEKLGKIGEELEKEEILLEMTDERKYGGHMEDKVFEELHMAKSEHPPSALEALST